MKSTPYYIGHTGSLLWLFLFLIFGKGIAIAQDHRLSLSVQDAETGTPLGLATVLIQPGERGGVTRTDGTLGVDLPAGEYEISVNFLGYRESIRRVTLNEPLSLTIKLESTATGLETVEVVGNDASDLLERPLLGVQRLSKKQLDELPAVLGETDVLKGLQMLPGVGSAGEASNGISVRGGSIDQNLVLLDHVPVFNPTHLFGLFSVFPPDGIRSADLYQGNVPARFGGRVASVLDVRMKSPSAEGLELQGGVGLISNRLSLEAPIVRDKLYILGAVRLGLNDFWFDVIEQLKDTRANFGDALLKLRWQAAEQHLFHLTGFYSRDYYQIDLISRLAGFTSDKNIYDYETLNGSLDWHYTLNDRTYLQTVLASADYTPSIRLPETGTAKEAVLSSSILYHSLQTSLHHRAAPNLQWSGGVQLIRYQSRPGTLHPGGVTSVNAVALPAETAYETAVYLEGEWEAGEHLSISTGLRYGHYFQMGPLTVRTYDHAKPLGDDSVTGQQEYNRGAVITTYGGWEPRFGLRWQATERLTLKAAYSANRQYLQNIFNATTPLPTSRWKTADQHIRPQSSHLVSAGVFYTAGSGYELGVEAYFRHTRDLLEYKPGAEFLLKKFVETELLQGEGRAFGLEFSLRKTAGRNTGWFNYTFSRVFNQVSGADFSNRINQGEWYPGNFDRPHTLNAVYTVAGNPHHTLSLNFTMSSGRPYTIPNGFVEIDDVGVPVFFERNNARIPAYHRLDFSWKILNPGMRKRRWTGEWIFTVYNLYGRKNAYNIYYGPRTGGYGQIFGNSPIGAYRISIFGAPIVSLSYQFKFR